MSVNAVIDIGTNSIKFLIVKEIDGANDILVDHNEIVRLGERVQETGLLSDEAMTRALSVMRDMVGEARRFGAARIVAVGTQALRISLNAREFVESIETQTGVHIDIIDGKEEADLSFLAAFSSLENDTPGCRRLCMFDVGGGSSEIVLGAAHGHVSRHSLPVGALTLHDMFFRRVERVEDNRAAVADVAEYIRALLKAEYPGNEKGSLFDCCIGIGGTIVTLASVMLALDTFDSAAISGVQLSVGEIDRQIALFASMCPENSSGIRGLDAKRADIILAGACIVREMLAHFGFSSLVVNNRGLRYGVMMKCFGLR